MDMLEYWYNELFTGIEQADYLRMMECSNAKIKKIPQGAYVFSQEDYPKELYILKSGKVQIFKSFPSGKRSMMYQISKQEVFGDNFFCYQDTTYSYDAIAAEASEVLVIPYSFVYQPCKCACAHHQTLIHNLLKIQSQNNSRVMVKLQIVSNTTIRQKIALWLFEKEKHPLAVPSELNREELAEYLGVTRPSLSRTLMEMQKLGWISTSGKKIKIQDMDALEALFDD